MSFTVLIPARLASTRLPNKALADIGGLPMIVRVAQRVALATLGRHADGAPATVWAVAGIARPEQFFAMLRARGVMLAGTSALADHGDIKGHDLIPADGHLLVCTEKDAAKVWALRPDALAVVLQLDIEAAFWSAFEEKLAAATSA